MGHWVLSRFGTVVTGLVVIAAAAGLPLAAPAFAATPIVLTMSSSASPSVAGDPVTLTFTFSRPFGGQIGIYLSEPGGKRSIGWYNMKVHEDVPDGSLSASSDVYLGSDRPSVGTWYIWARASGETAESNTVELDQVVVPIPATPLLSLAASPTPATAGASVRLTATLSSSRSGPPAGPGSVSFTEADQVLGVAQVVLVENMDGFGRASTSVGALAAGDHSVVATYTDPTGVPVLVSAPLLVHVFADTSVAASDVGIRPSTFYPVKDSYRDTLEIRGTLGEQASVSISIYSVATGKPVRKLGAGSRTGLYTVAWNGRNSSGVIQPAGRYRIVQTLVDAVGNRLSATAYATISLKTMTYFSASLTKSGAASEAIDASADFVAYRAGTSLVAYNLRLNPRTSPSNLSIAYRFTLPHTPRRSITFQVYSDCPAGTNGATIYVRTDSRFAGESAGCSPGWHSVSVGVNSSEVIGNVVNGTVTLRPGWMSFDGIRISQVRLKYTYGVLR